MPELNQITQTLEGCIPWSLLIYVIRTIIETWLNNRSTMKQATNSIESYSYFNLIKLSTAPDSYKKYIKMWICFEWVSIFMSSLILIYSVFTLILAIISIPNNTTVVSVLIILLLWSIGILINSICSVRKLNRGGPSGVASFAEIIVNESYERAMNKCLLAMFHYGANIIKYEELTGAIEAMSDRDRFRIEVRIIPNSGQCQIKIESDSKLPMVWHDWGRNSKNIQKIVREIFRV